MNLKTLDFAFKADEVKDSGWFSGHASVFGVVDAYREVVDPGAFAKCIKEFKRLKRYPPILWNHDSHEPLGPHIEMREDDVGLYIEGQLLIEDVPRARSTHANMRANSISGISIGFESIRDAIDKATGIRHLQEIMLWENSIVTFPANTQARVDAVKNAILGGEIPSIKEFERMLVDQLGFPKPHAKLIATSGYAELVRREAEPENVLSLEEQFPNLFKSMRSNTQ